MKKAIVLSVCAVTLLSGCGSYAGSGAYTGATFGTIIGSAIGGISGGPRGSDIGTLVGMAGGAMVGGAIGAQADKARQEAYVEQQQNFDQRYMEHRSAATQGNRQDTNGGYVNDNESGYDPKGGGDDVLYDFQSSEYTGNYTATQPEHVTPSVRYDEFNGISTLNQMPLEIRNARFVDDNQDGCLNPGETCKLIFEVYNTTSAALFDVQPTVVETTGNKQIAVSGTIHVESLNPGKGIRYTAMIQAAKRLKGEFAVFHVSAAQGSEKNASNLMEFKVAIKKR